MGAGSSKAEAKVISERIFKLPLRLKQLPPAEIKKLDMIFERINEGGVSLDIL
jgi:hypothetical protein